MQKARKALVAVLIAALLVGISLFALTACGGSKTAKSIEITTPPTKIDYVVGESFDPAGMAVSLVYDDDSKEALEASAYTVTPTGPLAANNRRITVTYKTEDGKDLTATQTITVHNNVTALSVKTPATKTGYVKGEVFDPTGMVVSATYENSETADIEITSENATYTKTPLTGSETEITVTYQGKEVKQAIEFATGVTIKTQPTKTEYVAGERFSPVGMVLEVTYPSGKKADVTVSGSIATYSTEPFTGSEKSVTVTYGGFEVTVNISFANGVFIEAEDGIIETNSTQWLREDANETFPKENQASGYLYVGDLSSGDSVSFIFNSDKAGTGDISFRMASQYVKEAEGWTPILIGDCQFNKICKFSVNGTDYTIPDSAVLPGGGESGGQPNTYLWTNWKEVEFNDITFVRGRNIIKLTFIPHDYTDVAQSVAGSYAGKFTANIDSLIIKSEECTVSPLKAKLEVSATSATLETKSDVTEFVVKGTADYENYTEDEVKDKLTLQIGATQLWGGWYPMFTPVDVVTTVTLTGKNFEIRANVDKIASNDGYTVNFMGSALTIAGAEKSQATCTHGDFETVVGDNGAITLKVTSKVVFTPTATTADIAVEGEKVVVTVTGTYEATGYDSDEIPNLLKKTMLEFQMTSGYWQSTQFYAIEATVGDGNSFTAKYDVTALGNGGYLSHFGNSNTNFVPTANIDAKTVTAGGHTYTLSADIEGVSDQNDASRFYGTVGLVIADATA